MLMSSIVQFVLNGGKELSFIIQRESFLDKLTQTHCRPLTEASSHLRFHTIAHSDDHIQVVVTHLPFDATIALLSN